MLHRKIVELRKSKKITQEGLSNKIGVSRSALSQYELGSRQPDYDIIKRMADYFDVSIDYLLGRETTEELHIEETEMDRIIRETNEILKTAKNLEQAQLMLDLAKNVFKK